MTRGKHRVASRTPRNAALVISVAVVIFSTWVMAGPHSLLSRFTQKPTQLPPAPTLTLVSSRPPTHSSSAPAPVPTGPALLTATPAEPPTLVYVVRSGDTLSGIAEYFRVHGFASLYRWNRAALANHPDLIRPGQRLIVVPQSTTSTEIVNPP